MALVVVATHGSIATSHEFSVNLCRDRDVLTNGKAKDILDPGKLEAVTGICYSDHMVEKIESTYMAVLGEILIFSWRGKFCHWSGLRALRLPEDVWEDGEL